MLPVNLSERLAVAARLRNLLVHRYWSVDDRRLYSEARAGLQDFEECARLFERVAAGGEARTKA